MALDEVKEILKSDQFDCYRIKVKDRFGDYGLVGFAVFDNSNKEIVTLKHFVFSCRAARKKIEQSFFEYMIEKYKNDGFNKLELVCKITEKNGLMREVLEDTGLFIKKDEVDGSYKLEHEMSSSVVKTDIVTVIEG